jgi:hypothetical protein
MGEIEQALLELVEVLEDREERPFTRIIVEPNGDIEVNARVIFRGDTHPTVFFVSRQAVQ